MLRSQLFSLSFPAAGRAGTVSNRCIRAIAIGKAICYASSNYNYFDLCCESMFVQDVHA